jgi:hypothetical protein
MSHASDITRPDFDTAGRTTKRTRRESQFTNNAVTNNPLQLLYYDKSSWFEDACLLVPASWACGHRPWTPSTGTPLAYMFEIP